VPDRAARLTTGRKRAVRTLVRIYASQHAGWLVGTGGRIVKISF